MLKKTLPIFLVMQIVFLITVAATAQKNVHFQINHFLGNSSFKMNKKVTNDLQNLFTITRLDYYVSKVILYHDGGKITEVKDKYILVRGGLLIDDLLGSFNITKLDSIQFYIGVDSPNNHADPLLFPSNHPLAPKNPEMQWGWAGGYRFVAIEGQSGTTLQFNYQIHALGDALYKPTTIVTKGYESNGELFISLDADYTKGLSNIDINKSLINHGSTDDVITLLANFNKKVFTPSQIVLATKEIEIGSLKIYPNPTMDQTIKIQMNDKQLTNATLNIRDVLGRLITILKPTTITEVQLENPGIYFIELIQEGSITHRSSVIKL